MGFFRQEYWSGWPCPPPGDPPNPGIEPRPPPLQEDSLPSEPPGKPMGFMPWVKLYILSNNSTLREHAIAQSSGHTGALPRSLSCSGNPFPSSWDSSANKHKLRAIPWPSRGWDPTLLQPLGVRVQSLVRELRSRKPSGMANTKLQL